VNGLDVDGAVQNYFNSSIARKWSTPPRARRLTWPRRRAPEPDSAHGGNTVSAACSSVPGRELPVEQPVGRTGQARSPLDDGIGLLYNIERCTGRPDQEGQGLVLRVGPRLRVCTPSRPTCSWALPGQAPEPRPTPNLDEKGVDDAGHQERAGPHRLADEPEKQAGESTTTASRRTAVQP